MEFPCVCMCACWNWLASASSELHPVLLSSSTFPSSPSYCTFASILFQSPASSLTFAPFDFLHLVGCWGCLATTALSPSHFPERLKGVSEEMNGIRTENMGKCRGKQSKEGWKTRLGGEDGGRLECVFCSTDTISSHIILPFIFSLRGNRKKSTFRDLDVALQNTDKNSTNTLKPEPSQRESFQVCLVWWWCFIVQTKRCRLYNETYCKGNCWLIPAPRH